MNLLTYQIVFLTKGWEACVHLRETTEQKKKREKVGRRGSTIRIEMTPLSRRCEFSDSTQKRGHG